jgi:hypothetical protein
MILNPFALTALFVGTISLALTAGSVFSALYFYRQWKRCESADEKARIGIRIHLSLLLLLTAFLLRLVSWPLFYILLQSYIPIVTGAMCIFGVTRVMPVFVAFLQILKPLAFFLIGGWLIFFRLDLSLRTPFPAGKSIRFLAVASAVAAVDCAAELLFIFLFTPPGVAVSCCTAVSDLVIPAAPLLPRALFSPKYHPALVAAYHGSHLALLGLLGSLIWRNGAKRPLLTLLAFLVFINGTISYGAFKEYLGPRLMHLPDHHCLYCLLQYRPASIAILGLLILGSFLAMWPRLLCHFASDEASEKLSVLIPGLLKYSTACILFSWLAATIPS